MRTYRPQTQLYTCCMCTVSCDNIIIMHWIMLSKPIIAPADCKFRDAQCHSCGKTGHIAPVCRSRPLQSKEGRVETHHLQDDEQSPDDAASSDSEFLLYRVGSRSSDSISVPMLLNGQELAMEVDTGAALSVISESTCQSVCPKEPLHPSKLIL